MPKFTLLGLRCCWRGVGVFGPLGVTHGALLVERASLARPLAIDTPWGYSSWVSESTNTQKVDLALQGMTCAACAARIEKVLNRRPGVSAAVNFATERAQVSFCTANNTVADLVATVAKAGYAPKS